MPAKLSTRPDAVTNRAIDIGKQLRVQRKALGVSATTAAEAAGMSRVTWYRVEKGMTSITLGALLSALDVLGLDLRITPKTTPAHNAGDNSNDAMSVPVHIALADYPQLKQIAWQVQGVDELSPREALTIYERNWRHLDLESMEPHERNLVKALQQIFTGDISHV